MPTAISARSTATRCARYQVLPTAAAHHQTVPVANTMVAAARTDERRPRLPSIHHASATPRAARPIATDSWSVASPNTSTNGTRTTAGSGGNGSSARPSGLPAASRSG